MSNDKSTLSLLPLHYNGHQIRTHVDEMGMGCWVAQDIAHVLGIKNVRQNIDAFPENEKGVCTIYTLGGPQELLTINEPGLYRLIFQSRKPEAEALKCWVFRDVLPTLRRTGSYTMPGIPPTTPTEPILTHAGHLPPPPVRIREHAEVSWHLAAVWTLMQTGEVLTNRDIAQRTGIAGRTARAHTHYLLYVGMLDLHETFPRHLYQLSPTAEKRNAGIFHRLTRLAELIAERQKF